MDRHRALLGAAVAAGVWMRYFNTVQATTAASISVALAVYVAGVICWFLWGTQLYPRFFSPLRGIPGPKGGSLFMGQFWRNLKETQGEPLREWAETIPHDGLIRYLDIFNMERIAVLSPKALAEILVTRPYDFIKPPTLIRGLGRILGVGLFLAEGDEHKKQRKDLMPAFAFRHIKDLYPVFLDKSRALVEALTAQVRSEGEDSAVVDVGGWVSRAALDIIGVAGLGKDFQAIQDPDNELHQTYRRIFSTGRTGAGQLLGVLSFFLPAWFIRALPIRRNKDIGGASSIIKESCRSLIRSRMQQFEKGENANKDIISVAMSSGAFTEEELVNQIMTFLIAGHETTASSLSWAVYVLCQYPEMQTRLRNEIASKAPDILKGKSVSHTDIDQCEYLHAICNEILRLYPPVALTVRVAAKDTSLCDHIVPKDTMIVLSPWAVNRNTALWGPDSMTFNPDRWMDGKTNSGGSDSNFAMLTFLHGPRSCIGSSFAKAEFACLLAAWVQSFESSFADPDYVMKVKNGITARPKDLMVRLRIFDRM